MWTWIAQYSCDEKAPGKVVHRGNKRKNSGTECSINFARGRPPTLSKNSDFEHEVEAVEDRIRIFNNIFAIFKSPFVEDI